jgi:hypothetical protein
MTDTVAETELVIDPNWKRVAPKGFWNPASCYTPSHDGRFLRFFWYSFAPVLFPRPSHDCKSLSPAPLGAAANLGATAGLGCRCISRRSTSKPCLRITTNPTRYISDLVHIERCMHSNDFIFQGHSAGCLWPRAQHHPWPFHRSLLGLWNWSEGQSFAGLATGGANLHLGHGSSTEELRGQLGSRLAEGRGIRYCQTSLLGIHVLVRAIGG